MTVPVKVPLSETCVKTRRMNGKCHEVTARSSDLVHGVRRQRVAALGVLQEFNQFIRKADVLQERHQIHSSEGEKKESNSKDRAQVSVTHRGRVIICGGSHFMAA